MKGKNENEGKKKTKRRLLFAIAFGMGCHDNIFKESLYRLIQVLSACVIVGTEHLKSWLRRWRELLENCSF